MAEVSTIGLDIAKTVFHAHGADARGQLQISKRKIKNSSGALSCACYRPTSLPSRA